MKLKENPLVTALVGKTTTKLDSRISFFGKTDELSCHLMKVRALVQENDGILTKFVIPGQNVVSADIHIARCKVRDAELAYATFQSLRYWMDAGGIVQSGYNQEADAEAFAYMEEHGYKIAGPLRTTYIDGVWNQEDPEQWLSIIQIPIE